MDEDALPRALGAAIRERRHDRNFTQEQLAERAGLKRAYVALVERGQVNAGLVNVSKVAAALDMRLSELIRQAENRSA